MEFKYYKYEGTGNDFVMIDNRDERFDESNVEVIRSLCDRETGIGADGFIAINNRNGYDFEMKYYNADGNESTMCGNGGRCIIHMAHTIGITDIETKFIAIDGPHDGVFGETDVKLKMTDVTGYRNVDNDFVLDTGSPHYVVFVDDVASIDVFKEGKAIRNGEEFKREGINVLDYSLKDQENSFELQENGTYKKTKVTNGFNIHKEFYKVTEEIVAGAKLF